MKRLNHYIIFPSLNSTGIHLMKKGEIFAVESDSELSFYQITSIENITPNTTFQEALENGNLIKVSSAEYRQIITEGEFGDIFVIPLKNKNVNLNKHCFIEKYHEPVQNVDMILSNFNESDNKWIYDEQWVSKNGTLFLKSLVSYSMSEQATDDNTQYFEKSISTSDYKDITYISVSGL